ncbi:dihydroorotase [Thermaurantiacus sp.]
MSEAPPPLLFRGARLVDPASGLDQPGDLLVIDRAVAACGRVPDPLIPAGAEGFRVIEAGGLVLSPALVDPCVFRADLVASAAGGIATVLLMPDQSPPLDEPALVERAERLGKPDLWVRPLAAATRGLLGRELSELALLREAGAVAVATGRQQLADAAVMLRMMRYAAGLGLIVVSHAEDAALVAGAVATEGSVATRLGLPAAPKAAESLALARDLRLAREAGARLHVACVTTAESVALLRRAKGEGQDVTAATAPPYALLNDQAMIGYRSFARLSPPLRSEDDRLAVVEGLADGTIDMLASRHDPRTTEDKRQPFADAAPGAADASLLLPLGLSLVHAGATVIRRSRRASGKAPAARFGLPGGRLAVGAPADLLLFDPAAPWRVAADALPGLGRNTPFDGLPVQGRVRLLVKGGALVTEARS